MNRPKDKVTIVTRLGAVLAVGLLTFTPAHAESAVKVDGDGTIHVPAFDLPESTFISDETSAALKRQREASRQQPNERSKCPSMDGADRSEMPKIRQCEAEFFYKTPLYQSIRQRYALSMTTQDIGGVYTETFVPRQGIAPKNEKRVLINVHGGGFQGGSRTLSHVESIPVAAVGRIKVISIDYRMAPEYTFPAASEDVAAVYRELLKTYLSKNIGVYGCSAGGTLTSHSISWFQKERLPLPGAVGMFCAGAQTFNKGRWSLSDSMHIASAIAGLKMGGMPFPYFEGVDRNNPLASPGDYDEVMVKFPPSLLISGTRDFSLSSVIHTHAQLSRLGVEADLHVWEGWVTRSISIRSWLNRGKLTTSSFGSSIDT